MIRLFNGLRGCCVFLALIWAGQIQAAGFPVTEQIIEQGFPEKPNELATTTQSLLREYNEDNNIISLVFYAYGLLRQAKSSLMANDLVRASEFARTGFFYLDEAVDSNESNARVRYMRARIDAWLTTDKGRCVITLKDTQQLLHEKAFMSTEIIHHINGMRYRALLNCRRLPQAELLLAEISERDPDAATALVSGRTPAWDMNEVSQILLPLLKGK